MILYTMRIYRIFEKESIFTLWFAAQCKNVRIEGLDRMILIVEAWSFEMSSSLSLHDLFLQNCNSFNNYVY